MYGIDQDADPDNHFYNNISNNCEYYTDEQFISNVTMEGALSLVHFNSRSLYSNFSNIKTYLSKFKKFNIIAISETWLDNKKGYDVELEGYELFTTNRDATKGGGGVAVYVDTALRCRIVKNMSDTIYNFIEYLTIEIIVEKSKNIMISCVYRTPGTCLSFS